MLCSIPGSRGEGSDPHVYHQTTEVTLTKGSPERSGYMHIDKQVTLSILVMLFSSRGTETAKVEGLWLVNRPKCLVPEYPDDSPEVWWCSPFIVPSLNSMRDPHDVMIVCSDLPVGKPLHMPTRTTDIHLHIHQCPHWNPKYYESSKPLHLFPYPNSMPVTYRYYEPQFTQAYTSQGSLYGSRASKFPTTYSNGTLHAQPHPGSDPLSPCSYGPVLI